MKTTTRAFVLTLALSAIAAGCGKSEAATTNASTAKAAAPAAPAAPAKAAKGPCEEAAAAMCADAPAKCDARKAWFKDAISSLPSGKPVSPAEQIELCKGMLASKSGLDDWKSMAKHAVP